MNELVRTRVLRWASGIAAAVLFGTAWALHDVSAFIVASLLVAAFVWEWLRPRSRLAAAALVVVLADVAFFTGAAALSNVNHDSKVAAVVVPGAVAVAAVVAVGAGLVVLAAPGATGRFRPPLSPGVGVWSGLVTGALIAAVILVAPDLHAGRARPGEVTVRMRTTAYSKDVLRVRAGRAALFVSNGDLFWHTFTVDRLHLDVGVPVGGDRHVRITAPPGRYDFYCRVPGHRQAGMKGVLLVS
jgi:plastocyanin